MAQFERLLLACQWLDDMVGNYFQLSSWHLCFIFIVAFSLSACATSVVSTPLDCTGDGIAIIPTATRQTDPDLFSPPSPPSGGDGADYCPTPISAETPTEDFPEQFITTEVVNLSLDVANQDLAATAVGDDMLAVAWLSDGDIYVALSHGGNHFQVRRVDSGSSVSLAFSRANRLHVAYEQDGRILYRAADQGTHPADVAPLVVEDPLHPVTNGRTPQVVVDELNWAHVLYEQDGSIFKAKHLSNETWLTQFVAYGATPASARIKLRFIRQLLPNLEITLTRLSPDAIMRPS